MVNIALTSRTPTCIAVMGFWNADYTITKQQGDRSIHNAYFLPHACCLALPARTGLRSGWPTGPVMA